MSKGLETAVCLQSVLEKELKFHRTSRKSVSIAMANLADHILSQSKVVLFIDDVGFEQSAFKIAEKLFQHQNQKSEIFSGTFDFPQTTAVLLEPISKLELYHNEAAIISIVQKLRLIKNVSHVFCWITTKNLKSRLLTAFLAHMANVVVTVQSSKLLNILTKRKFASVRVRNFQHGLFEGSLSLKEIKQTVQKRVEEPAAPQPDQMGTFKIGDFNKSELEAKNNMKLPFELM